MSEAAPLKQVPFLGGMPVSEIGFGAAEIGNLYRELSDAEAFATLRAAVDAGVTLFDTAPFYGHGLSELRLGQFLRGRPRDSYVLSTKAGRYMVPPGEKPGPKAFTAPLSFLPVFDYSYDGTMRSLEQSRMRLGLPRPDVVFIHDLDRRNHGAAFEGHFKTAAAGMIRALDELKRGGDVGAIGIAVNEADTGGMLLAEGDFDHALVAGRYTLLDQSALDTFIPACEARGVKLWAGGVFNSGVLATGASGNAVYNYTKAPEAVLQRVRKLEAICARHGVPLAAAAMQFVKAHPAISSILIGASRPQSIYRSIEALRWPIPLDLWREIAEAGLIAATAPSSQPPPLREGGADPSLAITPPPFDGGGREEGAANFK